MTELYDRMAVVPDDFQCFYKPALEKVLGPISDPGYYVIKRSAIQLPEYGVMLTKEQVNFLVKEYLDRVLRTTITKSSSGYASVTGLKIKYVENPLVDKIHSEDGWITLQDTSKVSFDPEIFYEAVDPMQAKKDIEEIEAKMAAQKKASKEKKAAEKEEKAAKKAAKTSKGA